MSNYGSSTTFLSDELTQKVTSVSTTAVELFTGVSRNPERQIVRLRNDGNKRCYLGPVTVTSSGSTKGDFIEPGEVITWAIGDVALYGITASGTTSIIITELA